MEDGPGAAAMAEACGARPPVKPSDWPTITKRQRKNWYERVDEQMGNASEETARMRAGGAAEDGHGAVADAGTEKASGVTTTTDRVPMPASRGIMTKTQRRNWFKNAKGKWR